MGLGCYDEIKHLDSVLGSGRDPKGLAVSSFYKKRLLLPLSSSPNKFIAQIMQLCTICMCVFNWIFKGLNENRWFMQFWVIRKMISEWISICAHYQFWRINIVPLDVMARALYQNCGYPDQWFFNPIWSWKHLIHLLHRILTFPD